MDDDRMKTTEKRLAIIVGLVGALIGCWQIHLSGKARTTGFRLVAEAARARMLLFRTRLRLAIRSACSFGELR